MVYTIGTHQMHTEISLTLTRAKSKNQLKMRTESLWGAYSGLLANSIEAGGDVGRRLSSGLETNP